MVDSPALITSQRGTILCLRGGLHASGKLLKDMESGSCSTCSEVNVNFRNDNLRILSAATSRCDLCKFNKCFILDTPFVFFSVSFFSGVDFGNYKQHCHFS